ncbi:MAG: phenylalanine--tRNA ligase subunit beta [Alistipes sp.]|jgi:phenylalanyl-tRNA synthetase beta chain|nr:phenylalanine--tRNA ligase subunit beta [Alistipes sp.]
MKISYNWLRGYVRGEAFAKLSAGEVADILTSTGLEVDSVERIEAIPGGLAGVVVGEVLTCVDHPDSDHLHVTTVDVGTGDGPLNIVCGAHNVAAGQKVLVATVGTELRPKGSDESFKIKKSKIRGVESHGMICAEDELGLGDDHEGIMVLPAGAKPGTPAAEQLNLQGDWMIEIGLTPNRIDGGSHYGVARDLVACLKARGEDVELILPSVEAFSVDDHKLEIPVEVIATEAAPRYAGVTIAGLKFGPSPEWMQAHLRAIGLNPHNNLVDISNFVLHELGQPLHAFDAAKIGGRRVKVQTCPEGTPFKTLDGVERKLSASDLCICDAGGQPMCIAGVMGGMESGVSETTTEIFLESACFDPVWVRKTARRHSINSDASFLFERGVDPDITVYALKRAALLYRELAGGSVSSEVIDINPSPAEPFRFEFSLSSANALIGKAIPRQTVLQILAALGVEIEGFDHVGGDVLNVAVPPYRVDVRRPADLVEEILRIYGYNNVEEPAQLRSSLTVSPAIDRDKVQNVASDFLTSNGFTEIMSNSLTRAAYYDGLSAYPATGCVRILNPLSNDLNVMRQTLIFNALEAVALNMNHRNADLKLYEFGNCYFFDGGGNAHSGSGNAKENLLAPYKEVYRLGMTVTGLDRQPSWNGTAEKASFFTLSGIAGKLLERFGFDPGRMQCEPLKSDLFAEAITYRLNGKELLQMGAVAPTLLAAFDIKAPVWFLEMDFSHFAKAAAKVRVRAAELSRFPSVKRDLALLVDKSVTFRKLHDIAFGVEKKLLRSVTLFDVYEGDKLPEGKKSYALSFTLEDSSATLTDAAIDRVMGNLITQFEKHAGATVRS